MISNGVGHRSWDCRSSEVYAFNALRSDDVSDGGYVGVVVVRIIHLHHLKWQMLNLMIS